MAPPEPVRMRTTMKGLLVPYHPRFEGRMARSVIAARVAMILREEECPL